MVLHLGQVGGHGSSQEERLLILNMVKDSKISVDEGVKYFFSFFFLSFN